MLLHDSVCPYTCVKNCYLKKNHSIFHICLLSNEFKFYTWVRLVATLLYK